MKLVLPLVLLCLAGATCARTVQDLESELLQAIREMVGDPQQGDPVYPDSEEEDYPYTEGEEENGLREDDAIEPEPDFMEEEDPQSELLAETETPGMDEREGPQGPSGSQGPPGECSCPPPSGIKYTSLGCWKDRSNRAMQELEGTDPRLDGGFRGRANPIQKCYQVALSRGFTLFAVQKNGKCFGAPGGNNYKKYGPSTACKPNGEGGPWANEVYKIGADCAEYKAFGDATSGVYTLGGFLAGVQAYCDMDTAGGGWTVIQRRQDGSVPFNRNWKEYKQGFGNKNGEYWLGNDNIHLLTSQKNYTLRVDLKDLDKQTRFAEYSTFRVSGESEGYRLTVSGYTGDAGDDMTLQVAGDSMTGRYSSNGQKFSTMDRDNDACPCHCSQLNGQGGWWFGFGCGFSFLNGQYLGNCGNSCPMGQGVVWFHWRGTSYSLKSVSMKIRPYP